MSPERAKEGERGELDLSPPGHSYAAITTLYTHRLSKEVAATQDRTVH